MTESEHTEHEEDEPPGAFFCALDCGWSYKLPQNYVDTAPFSQLYGLTPRAPHPDTIRQMEEAIRAHYAKHKPLEWATAYASLQEELRRSDEERISRKNLYRFIDVEKFMSDIRRAAFKNLNLSEVEIQSLLDYFRGILQTLKEEDKDD